MKTKTLIKYSICTSDQRYGFRVYFTFNYNSCVLIRRTKEFVEKIRNDALLYTTQVSLDSIPRHSSVKEFNA